MRDRGSVVMGARIRSLLACVLRMRALRLVMLMCIYGAALGLSLFFAYQLRFDFDVPGNSVVRAAPVREERAIGRRVAPLNAAVRHAVASR